ncbi:nucleotidyltransferase family protein [Xanthobacter versatilis]|uniref:nucleotidyltransferase family protein n=1 Tax=Xanthobacter autotrophicus (strain ATCC BAA-1158 / Py2) TaxID=78245 RepID=UPI00059EE5B3
MSGRELVREWAGSQPLIAEVWLFGSRAKGAERGDSDMDLAIVLAADTENLRLAYWIECADAWKQQLSEVLSVTISINHLDWSRSTGIVLDAVRDHGQRLYLRSGD